MGHCLWGSASGWLGKAERTQSKKHFLRARIQRPWKFQNAMGRLPGGQHAASAVPECHWEGKCYFCRELGKSVTKVGKYIHFHRFHGLPTSLPNSRLLGPFLKFPISCPTQLLYPYEVGNRSILASYNTFNHHSS
jgi:hypothetical protein